MSGDYDIKKVKEYIYEVPKKGKMKVPMRLYASEKILEEVKKDRSVEQATNVAELPGIEKASFVMPDAHQGYGFSIGGVAAFNFEEGIISPGGVGFDINCGVRLLKTNLDSEEVTERRREITNNFFKNCPTGVGSKSSLRISVEEENDLLKKGARWAVDRGIGKEEDIKHCESQGCLEEADPDKVSHKAKKRGRKQVGTVGSGNHFIEVQRVEEIYHEEKAEAMGIEKGQVVAMVHCGSRGFGHQVCSDYVRKMEKQKPAVLPSKNLIYAKLGSKMADDYYKAMCCAANYAWCNRHVLSQRVREGFKEVFGDETEVKTVYDVAHNIAKRETHKVNGEEKDLMVHRKGATRAFPKGRPEVPEVYKKIGQPVIIPGTMGTSSYLLVGGKNSLELSFGSSAHGAGRLMSRKQATKDFDGRAIRDRLREKKIYLKPNSMKGTAEESPGAYKDVDEVIKVSNALGLAEKVARFKPIGVIKG